MSKDLTLRLPQAFKEWAESNDVELEFIEDWEPWYDCWISGYNNGRNDERQVKER